MPRRSAAFIRLIMFWSVVGRIIFGDAETLAHFPDTNSRPGLAIAGLAAHSVERHGKLSIRPMSGEFAQGINGRRRHVARVAAGFDTRNANFRVTAAGPVDQQHGVVGRLVKLADDLADQDMDQALLGSRIGRGRVPRCRQIMGKLHEHGPVDLGARCRGGAQILIRCSSSATRSRRVPTRFEFACHMTLGRIHQFVASCGDRHLVSRRFKISFNGCDDVVG